MCTMCACVARATIGARPRWPPRRRRHLRGTRSSSQAPRPQLPSTPPTMLVSQPLCMLHACACNRQHCSRHRPRTTTTNTSRLLLRRRHSPRGMGREICEVLAARQHRTDCCGWPAGDGAPHHHACGSQSAGTTAGHSNRQPQPGSGRHRCVQRATPGPITLVRHLLSPADRHRRCRPGRPASWHLRATRWRRAPHATAHMW
jgi:hypothetical protein